MKVRWLVLAIVAIGVIAAEPALARTKQRTKLRCADQQVHFSWDGLGRYLFIPTDRAPKPNGCSPAVYTFGKFIGQDPDRNIRFQLNRDPATGYSPL
jgi:hypothetical protein